MRVKKRRLKKWVASITDESEDRRDWLYRTRCKVEGSSTAVLDQSRFTVCSWSCVGELMQCHNILSLAKLYHRINLPRSALAHLEVDSVELVEATPS